MSGGHRCLLTRIRGSVSRSTLAHANEHRPWQMYADLVGMLPSRHAAQWAPCQPGALPAGRQHSGRFRSARSGAAPNREGGKLASGSRQIPSGLRGEVSERPQPSGRVRQVLQPPESATSSRWRSQRKGLIHPVLELWPDGSRRQGVAKKSRRLSPDSPSWTKAANRGLPVLLFRRVEGGEVVRAGVRRGWARVYASWSTLPRVGGIFPYSSIRGQEAGFRC
jgi:hypothetical protein